MKMLKDKFKLCLIHMCTSALHNTHVVVVDTRLLQETLKVMNT